MTGLGAAVFYWLALSLTLRINATFLVSDERPCSMERVTFTCTAPGANLRWSLSDVSNINVNQFTPLNTPLMPQPGYTVTRVALNNTSIASTLSRIAKDGVMVTCLNPSNEIGSATIQLAVPPSLPQRVGHSVDSSSADRVSVIVGWDPPTETGGRDDLTYTVTISLSAQLSATIQTSTSVTVTAQYNMDYNVSIVATNCAGNSTTAEYNFRIGGCPVLIKPTNGAFRPVSSRLPESTVTIQCDAGYVSPVTVVTCEGTLMWSPYPEAIECRSTTEPTPPPMRCTDQLDPPQNGTTSNHSVPAIPGTQVNFQCNNGLFPEGIMTATCLATGEWDKNPGENMCRNEPISCVLPAPPFNGALLNTNSQNTNLTESSIITFQCDPGFSLVGAATVTCNNSGLWYPDPALLQCIYISFPSPTLSTDAAVSISVVVTAVAFTVIGFLTGLLVMHLCSCKKAVYSPAAKGHVNVGPTAPAGPVYEEVSPKDEIELNTNQAYGPVGL
ncbi:complement receptor type 2-like isoform X2 [Halichondria panicea]|uniref:complement receptor type 2-like isoform X2 n=1 Tax=Halichondria panicea TaxID=6063 RepID=UPI00312BC1AF